MKILASEKLIKIDEHFYQIALFVPRENRIALKIKSSTLLFTFEMTSLK